MSWQSRISMIQQVLNCYWTCFLLWAAFQYTPVKSGSFEQASAAAASASTGTQQQHTFKTITGELPPASPCGALVDQNESKETIFLIGAYVRYKRPYVWVRSSARLDDESDSDSPLSLQSTDMWQSDNDGMSQCKSLVSSIPTFIILSLQYPLAVRIWDIVEELVRLNVAPEPVNPFSIAIEVRRVSFVIFCQLVSCHAQISSNTMSLLLYCRSWVSCRPCSVH